MAVQLHSNGIAESQSVCNARCLQALQANGKDPTQQHLALAKWILQSYRTEGLAPFAIRNPDAPCNRKWCVQLKVFATYSSYAQILVTRVEKEHRWETVIEVILSGKDHEELGCRVCSTAREVREVILAKVASFFSKEEIVWPDLKKPGDHVAVEALSRRIELLPDCDALSQKNRESLARIMLQCSESIRKTPDVGVQHRVMVGWAWRSSSLVGITPKQIKSLSKQLLELIPNAPFIQFCYQSVKKYPERPPFDVIFEDALHPECSFCIAVRGMMEEAGEELSKRLL